MRSMSPPFASLVAPQHWIYAISDLSPINAGVTSQAGRGLGSDKNAFATRLSSTRQRPMRDFIHIFGYERRMSPTEAIPVIILLPERATAALNDVGLSFCHVGSL
ncbi:hypothetical protein MHY1_00668 [Methylovirgula sp. HY1]|nr:hypothetical protein MHY1_00668 [Methylovirgula sp. HY1]